MSAFVVFHFDWDILTVDFGEESTETLLMPLIHFIWMRIVTVKEYDFESVVAFIYLHIITCDPYIYI